jgi:hypothetical protein
MFTYYRFSKLRLILAVSCFLGVVWAPWWVPLLIAIALCLRFRAWEVVLAGMFMDLYWMPQYLSFSFDAIPLATIASVVILFGLEPLRRQLLVGPEIR